MTQQRGNDEIRRDLALEVLHHGDLCMDFAGDRLIGDVAPLLARVSELEQENERLREIDAQQVRDLNQADARAERAEAQVQRVEAMLDQYDRYEEPMPSDRRHGRVARAEVRAALGSTE